MAKPRIVGRVVTKTVPGPKEVVVAEKIVNLAPFADILAAVAKAQGDQSALLEKILQHRSEHMPGFPAWEISRNRVRFKKPDGKWSEWLDWSDKGGNGNGNGGGMGGGGGIFNGLVGVKGLDGSTISTPVNPLPVQDQFSELLEPHLMKLIYLAIHGHGSRSSKLSHFNLQQIGEAVYTLGRKLASNSAPVVLSEEDYAMLQAIRDAMAGQVDQSLFVPGLGIEQPIGGIVDDDASTTVLEHTTATARITPKRALHVNLRDNAGAELGTTTNPVRVNIADFLTEVMKGNVPGHTLIRKMGFNPDIDAAAAESVWNTGGVYTFPTTPAALSIVSSSVLDVSVNVTISGLDATFSEISETVVTNGVVPVATTQIFSRVNEVFLSNVTNLGTITVTLLGATQATIPADGTNRGLLARYTVPVGKTAFLTEVVFGVVNGTASAGRGLLFVREDASVATSLLQLRDNLAVHSQGSQITSDYESPLRIPQRSDIEIRGSVSADNCGVTAGFSLLLVNN